MPKERSQEHLLLAGKEVVSLNTQIVGVLWYVFVAFLTVDCVGCLDVSKMVPERVGFLTTSDPQQK